MTSGELKSDSLVVFGAGRTVGHADALALVAGVGHAAPGLAAQDAAVRVVHFAVRLQRMKQKRCDQTGGACESFTPVRGRRMEKI